VPTRYSCVPLAVIFASVLAAAPRSACAQQAAEASDRVVAQASVDGAAQPDAASAPGRIFGVLPNHSGVARGIEPVPLSAGEKFRLARLNAFDPFVFSFVGAVTSAGAGPSGADYSRRYSTGMADHAISSLLTTGVIASALHQDPRYFELGKGSVWHRAAYALSRTVVTRSDSGRFQPNLAEVGGNALTASLANAYYPSSERSATATLTRWGSQVVWDGLANELKEFWPDVRRMIQRN